MAARLILEVRWGRLAGAKAVIEPFASLRVGRSPPADLCVPHDERLSALHFELRWDGAEGRVVDLGGAGATLLDGAPVTQAPVAHGAWIRAGCTDFMVYVEGHSTRHGGRAPDGAPGRALEVLRAAAREVPLFAVLDASRSDRIPVLLRESVEPHRSLYEGAQGDALEDVAPYLAGPLGEGSRLLAAVVQEGWGKRWGIFLGSRASSRDLRRHLRRFLMVELSRGRRAYFRFYDPRVLRVFLETCTIRQQSTLGAEVDSFLFEGEDLGVTTRVMEQRP